QRGLALLQREVGVLAHRAAHEKAADVLGEVVDLAPERVEVKRAVAHGGGDGRDEAGDLAHHCLPSDARRRAVASASMVSPSGAKTTQYSASACSRGTKPWRTSSSMR